MKLEPGQVAVVTGGASGIGRALGEAFAARGLSVVLADVEPGALDAAGTELRSGGADVLTHALDVRHGDEVDALAAAALARFGRVDVVCNNAGVNAPCAPMWELTADDWAWVLEVNLWGVIHGIRAFVPHLVERGSGHVLNTASMGGLLPLVGYAPYAASKHAVVAITESLRLELEVAGVSVGTTVLCPSYTTTNIGTSARNRPVDRVNAAESKDFRGPPRATASASMTAEAVAADAIDGIEHDRLVVMPTPGSEDAVRDRAERLIGD